MNIGADRIYVVFKELRYAVETLREQVQRTEKEHQEAIRRVEELERQLEAANQSNAALRTQAQTNWRSQERTGILSRKPNGLSQAPMYHQMDERDEVTRKLQDELRHAHEQISEYKRYNATLQREIDRVTRRLNENDVKLGEYRDKLRHLEEERLIDGRPFTRGETDQGHRQQKYMVDVAVNTDLPTDDVKIHGGYTIAEYVNALREAQEQCKAFCQQLERTEYTVRQLREERDTALRKLGESQRAIPNGDVPKAQPTENTTLQNQTTSKQDQQSHSQEKGSTQAHEQPVQNMNTTDKTSAPLPTVSPTNHHHQRSVPHVSFM
jgi:chromosome segregation ATPase